MQVITMGICMEGYGPQGDSPKKLVGWATLYTGTNSILTIYLHQKVVTTRRP